MKWEKAMLQSRTQTAIRHGDGGVWWRADRHGRVEEWDIADRIGWIAPVDRDAHDDWEPMDPWDAVTLLSKLA